MRTEPLAWSDAGVRAMLADGFPGVVVLGAIGCGRRCMALAARSGGRDVVLKLYRPRALVRQARQYGGSLAKFEYERNLTVHRYPGFAAFRAAPIGFRSLPRAEIFLQERIFGELLLQFLRTSSAVTRRRLIADLRSILDARPILFDFNKVPNRVRRSSGLLGWCRIHGVLGYRSDDHRHLRRIEHIGRSLVGGSAAIRALE